MNAPVQTEEINKFISSRFTEVFDTMLSMQACYLGNMTSAINTDRVTGSVGFEGEKVAGNMYLHLSRRMANRAAAAILAYGPEDPPVAEAEVNDVVCELTNMVCGGFKSWLSDLGSPCAMSTPAITRGAAFAIEPAPDFDRICLSFDCEKERVLFEVHIKFK